MVEIFGVCEGLEASYLNQIMQNPIITVTVEPTPTEFHVEHFQMPSELLI